MRKIFLILLIFLGVFFIIFIFINPDQFRPLITSQIKKYTGCQLIIDDHLSLAFFPTFGVKINHLQLMTPSAKLEMKNAMVKLKLLPLLRGNFKTGAIQIDQVTFNQQNSLSTIQLSNVRLDSSAANQLDNSYLTNLSFDFDETSLPLSLHANLTGNVTIDFIKQTGTWENLKATLPDLVIRGELHANNILSDLSISGKLALQSSHINNIVRGITDLNADIKLFANKHSLDIQSNLFIRNLKMSNIDMDDVKIKLHFDNKSLNIESMRANLFGGFLEGDGNMRFNSYLPVMTAHVKAYNIQLVSLLGNTDPQILPISGTGNIELNVSATGTNPRSILTSLNGTSHVSITSGILAGKDWNDVVARSAASNNAITQEMISQYLHVLRFKQLSASFKIQNGMLDSDDLWLDSADINIRGKGKIDFPNNLVDYALQVEFQDINHYSPETKIALARVALRRTLLSPRIYKILH